MHDSGPIRLNNLPFEWQVIYPASRASLDDLPRNIKEDSARRERVISSK